MSYVDLHLHTHYSDGSDPPERVAQRASALSIAAIAIVDHDTVSGVAEAQQAAANLGLGFLTGTEISARFESNEVHIIGLGVDFHDPVLADALGACVAARCARGIQMIARLAELGFELDADLLTARAAGGAVSRMHIAVELRNRGITKSTQEGFDRFLNSGRPAYVPKMLMPARNAIDLIHQAGGFAFLAHPGLSKSIRRLLTPLYELPFDGIEAYHVSHSNSDTGDFLAFAERRRLLVTGGSDCHGSMKGAPEMGKVKTPVFCYETILAALQTRF
ncbi:MAG TPA: PHP domain-containing protein [Candidatus Hydrogenedentes bacterium]|nr:PHP domain-containing protein [Candidatus Hydrogenedentota bacterium]